jgi:hypothetical protein
MNSSFHCSQDIQSLEEQVVLSQLIVRRNRKAFLREPIMEGS